MTVQLKFESQSLASVVDSARLCSDENASPVAVPSPEPTRSSPSSQINIDLGSPMFALFEMSLYIILHYIIVVENSSTSRTSSSGSGSGSTGPSGADQVKVVVPIRGISLASKVVNKVISQDRVLLSAFNQSGLCKDYPYAVTLFINSRILKTRSIVRSAIEFRCIRCKCTGCDRYLILYSCTHFLCITV